MAVPPFRGFITKNGYLFLRDSRFLSKQPAQKGISNRVLVRYQNAPDNRRSLYNVPRRDLCEVLCLEADLWRLNQPPKRFLCRPGPRYCR